MPSISAPDVRRAAGLSTNQLVLPAVPSHSRRMVPTTDARAVTLRLNTPVALCPPLTRARACACKRVAARGAPEIPHNARSERTPRLTEALATLKQRTFRTSGSCIPEVGRRYLRPVAGSSLATRQENISPRPTLARRGPRHECCHLGSVKHKGGLICGKTDAHGHECLVHNSINGFCGILPTGRPRANGHELCKPLFCFAYCTQHSRLVFKG